MKISWGNYRLGLPTVNFEMGFTRTGMGYNLFMMGYIVGVHNLLSEMEGFYWKT